MKKYICLALVAAMAFCLSPLVESTINKTKLLNTLKGDFTEEYFCRGQFRGKFWCKTPLQNKCIFFNSTCDGKFDCHHGDEMAPICRQCGLPNFPFETRFNESLTIIPNTFPWLVHVGNKTTKLQCIGTILAPNWVITPASCLIDADGNVNETEIVVTLRKGTILDQPTLESIIRPNSTFVIPAFETNNDIDIAMLHVPQLGNEHHLLVRPICPPNEHEIKKCTLVELPDGIIIHTSFIQI